MKGPGIIICSRDRASQLAKCLARIPNDSFESQGNRMKSTTFACGYVLSFFLSVIGISPNTACVLVPLAQNDLTP
uniref:Uncharacterized protein n=1 Tax=Candidatus Kentrum sp. UNK TaxID=2126344 RepID=A0A451AP40_9GAMM|nr:MAG: hypothetical protein BECKUNK1418G_GA0071005_11654 [Candidatus Kentron sp. UNK]VFK73115.1 MAG: hypothetical protein BECKUNK1418H_GA0071006_11644 [Candidatus Kentron sp. UNK]